MTDEPAIPGNRESNGYIERWIETLKEQCVWSRFHTDIDELNQGVAAFTILSNTQWLIQSHSHCIPARPRRRPLPHEQHEHSEVTKRPAGPARKKKLSLPA